MLNSKKDSIGSIFLNTVVDSIFELSTTAGNAADNYTYISTSAGTCSPYATISDPIYTIQYPKNYFWQVIEDFTCPAMSVPSYPVSNFSLDESGTTIVDIAVSGFSDNEITIKRDGLKLIVEGKREEKEKEKRKYFYKNIAERNFKLEYQGSDKWDFDKLEARMKKGILTIEVPLKEEHKPIRQEFTIKK